MGGLGRKPIGTVAYMGGVPAVLEEFCWSWGQLIQYNNEYLVDQTMVVHYDRSRVSYHSWARNDLAERFLGDWILMLDCDHSFEPDIAARLLIKMQQHDVDVLTAVYRHRKAPHYPVLYKWKENGFTAIYKYELDPGEELLPIDSSGAGTLLIKRSVFDRIRDELQEPPFEPIGEWGEDHSFFRRLMRLGIKAYAIPMIQSFHLVTQPLAFED